MFEEVDFSKNIESIVSQMERNVEKARSVRKQIEDLKVNSDNEADSNITSFGFKINNQNEIEEELEKDEMIADYISLYRLVDAKEEDIISILPDPEDYSYQDVLLKLYATSLKEIKEMTEMGLEDKSYNHQEVQSFIENEKEKMKILWNLMYPEKESKDEEVKHNKILLMPTINGKYRILEDLDKIPFEYYDEIHDLIYSIIDGSFKRVKRFTSTNTITEGAAEVRGFKGRVFFQRLAKNTYVLICAFIKKTTNDHGYQDFIRNRISEYRSLEEELKKKINDPEFMKINDLYVEELWNKLGYQEEYKELRKKRDEV